MIAKGNIPAFSTITPGILEAQTVPKESITDGDLTLEQFEKNSAGGNSLVNRIELIAGQRVPLGAVTESSTGSLAAVKNGERVIALNATFSGSVAGIAIAGSVVDVYAGAGAGAQNGSQAIVENAKVLALGVGAAATANVRPGVKSKDQSQSDTSTGEGIVVVLIVPASDAAALLALSQASLALNPRLSFTENGTICPINLCAKTNSSTKQSQDDQPTEGADAPAIPDQPAGP